jgi:hypothetical protein
MMVSPGQRARTRLRNRRAALTAAGLVALAIVCVALLASTFAGVGTTKKVVVKKKATVRVAHATTTRAPDTTTVAPATTAPAPSTSTTPTTARTTTTTARPTATTVVATPTPSTLPAATAFASIADLPEWCTVTVHVSNGASHAYQLAAYLQNPGDLYVFTAYVGGYKVDVTTKVVDRNNAAECNATLANLGPA